MFRKRKLHTELMYIPDAMSPCNMLACAVQVVRNASQGVLLFSDSLTSPSWIKDVWAQYDNLDV